MMKEQPSSSILMFTDQQRQTFRFEPPDDRHWCSPTVTVTYGAKKKRKGVLLPSVALKASFPLWDGKRGEQVFLDYRAGKVFWCSTCSCLIKLHLKVLSPRTQYDSEQPTLSHDDLRSLCYPDTLEHFGEQNLFFSLFFSPCFCS